METNGCDDSHENSPGAHPTTNNCHHRPSKNIGVRIVDHIGNTTE